jgi:hypothetical protein
LFSDRKAVVLDGKRGRMRSWWPPSAKVVVFSRMDGKLG